MKPAPFAYVRPGSVDDALVELSADGAKVLAGGQSLVPILAMRLGRPSTLVDINAIATLAALEPAADGLRVGATVRQRAVQGDPEASRVPLLAMGLPWVGHRELRSRGTICGSLAHADPAAELPAVACCVDATIAIAGPSGERTVAASEFFTGTMSTAVAADELVTSVHFPAARPAQGFAFAEVARRHGDFALAGVAVRVEARDALAPVARVTCFGVSDRPVVRDLSGCLAVAVAGDGARTPEAHVTDAVAEGCAELADEVVDTVGDIHASTAYRRQLIASLTRRELARAYIRATADLEAQ